MLHASRGNAEILLRTLALTIRAGHPTTGGPSSSCEFPPVLGV